MMKKVFAILLAAMMLIGATASAERAELVDFIGKFTRKCAEYGVDSEMTEKQKYYGDRFDENTALISYKCGDMEVSLIDYSITAFKILMWRYNAEGTKFLIDNSYQTDATLLSIMSQEEENDMFGKVSEILQSSDLTAYDKFTSSFASAKIGSYGSYTYFVQVSFGEIATDGYYTIYLYAVANENVNDCYMLKGIR